MNSSVTFQHDMFVACILNVLEKAVFTMAELVDSGDDGDLRDPIAVEVSYRGIIEGKIQLVASDELCTEMAADMLGIDSTGITREQATDFLAELANMFAGRWITDCIGEMPEVTLTIPLCISGDTRNLISSSPNSRCFVLRMDSGILHVNWSQDQ